MSSSSRIFAVIPAAGHSRRMGAPKLLLTLGGQTVIERLLGVLDRPEIADRVVVLRRDDVMLREAVIRTGGTVVQPAADPPDMRASVEHALHVIRSRHAPTADDGWLIVPADHPLLAPAVLNALLARWNSGGDRILVPVFAARRGHPALFRWNLADDVAAIPHGHGLNWLLERHHDHVAELTVDDDSILLDLDTPQDLAVIERKAHSLDDREEKVEDRLDP